MSYVPVVVTLTERGQLNLIKNTERDVIFIQMSVNDLQKPKVSPFHQNIPYRPFVAFELLYITYYIVKLTVPLTSFTRQLN